MAGSTTYTLTIKSNNGANTIFKGLFTQSQTVTITETGLSSNQLNYSMINSGFLGFATSSGATTPTYAVGRSVTLGATNTTWYIVGAPSGGETTPAGMTIKYNGNTIFTNSNITSELAKTLQCSGKLMSGNVEIEVAPGQGGGGGTVQTATGSFYAVQSGVEVTCPFRPDLLIVQPPETYVELGYYFHNMLVFDFRNTSVGDAEIGVTYVGDGYGTYYTCCGYTDLKNNGFVIYSLQKVSANGQVTYYTNHDPAFIWKAIKLS